MAGGGKRINSEAMPSADNKAFDLGIARILSCPVRFIFNQSSTDTMNLYHHLFEPRGRKARRAWWRWMLLASIACLIFALPLTRHSPKLLLPVVLCLLCFAAVAFGSRRR